MQDGQLPIVFMSRVLKGKALLLSTCGKELSALLIRAIIHY